MKIINCSLCQSEIQVDKHCEDDPVNKAILYSGAANYFTIGYGSKFDGETWLIALCDECLSKLKPLEIEEYMYNTPLDFFSSE